MLALRPWFWGDTATAAIAIAVVWLLVFFTRGRSFAAIGAAMCASLAFIAVTPDFGAALFDPGYGDYGSRMGFIAFCSLAGAGLGALARGLCAAVARTQDQPSLTGRDTPSCPLGRWLVAWIIAGFLCGMIAAILTVRRYESWLAIEGCSTGFLLVVGLLSWAPASRSARLASLLDCLLVSILTAGIGGLSFVVIDKLTWPMLPDAFRLSDAEWENRLTMLIGSSAGIGAALGPLCWAIGALRRRKAHCSGIDPQTAIVHR
jgi:hypothetical protein